MDAAPLMNSQKPGKRLADVLEHPLDTVVDALAHPLDTSKKLVDEALEHPEIAILGIVAASLVFGAEEDEAC